MLKLRIVFPYGLNDKIGDEFKDEYSHCCVGLRFEALERQKPRVNRGTNRKGISNITCDDFF